MIDVSIVRALAVLYREHWPTHCACVRALVIVAGEGDNAFNRVVQAGLPSGRVYGRLVEHARAYGRASADYHHVRAQGRASADAAVAYETMRARKRGLIAAARAYDHAYGTARRALAHVALLASRPHV